MATWASDLDVLADLDRLSEFSAGYSTKEVEIVSCSSYGRGKAVEDDERARPLSPVPRKKKDYFPSLPSISPGCGRGDRLLAVSKHRENQSLHRQLRMAMGPGYSNELIEDFIRGDSPTDDIVEAGQFDDRDSLSDVTIDSNAQTDDLVSGYDSSELVLESGTSSMSDPPLVVNPVPAKKPVKLVDSSPEVNGETATPKKEGIKRSRNALLNNLPLFNTDTVNNSDESPSQAEDQNCCAVSNMWGGKSGGSKNDLATKLLQTKDGFQYDEKEFPPL